MSGKSFDDNPHTLRQRQERARFQRVMELGAGMYGRVKKRRLSALFDWHRPYRIDLTSDDLTDITLTGSAALDKERYRDLAIEAGTSLSSPIGMARLSRLKFKESGLTHEEWLEQASEIEVRYWTEPYILLGMLKAKRDILRIIDGPDFIEKNRKRHDETGGAWGVTWEWLIEEIAELEAEVAARHNAPTKEEPHG